MTTQERLKIIFFFSLFLYFSTINSINGFEIYEDFSNCSQIMCSGNLTDINNVNLIGTGLSNTRCILNCNYKWYVYQTSAYSNLKSCSNVTIKNGVLDLNNTHICKSDPDYNDLNLYFISINLSDLYPNQDERFFINNKTTISFYRRGGSNGCSDGDFCSSGSVFQENIFYQKETTTQYALKIFDKQGSLNNYCTWKKSSGIEIPGTNYLKYERNLSGIYGSCGDVSYSGVKQINFSKSFDIIRLSIGDMDKNGANSFLLDEINISGIYDIEEPNNLPEFNLTFDENACINNTGGLVNFNYSCYDPEGDTCYYALSDTTFLKTMDQVLFEDYTDYLEFGNENVDDSLLDKAIIGLISIPYAIFEEFVTFSFKVPVNTEKTNDQTIYDNKTIFTSCNAGDPLQYDVDVFTTKNPYKNGYMMYNKGCTDDITIILSDPKAYPSNENIFSFEYILTNNSDPTTGYSSENRFELWDSTKTNATNFNIVKNWSNGQLRFLVDLNLEFNRTLPSDYNKLADGRSSNYLKINTILNYSNSKYFFSIWYYNVSYGDYQLLNRTREFSLTAKDLKYFNIVNFISTDKYYIDTILYYTYGMAHDWSSTLNPYFSVNETGIHSYTIFVSDDVHKDSGLYNKYEYEFNVFECSYLENFKPNNDGFNNVASGDFISAFGALKKFYYATCGTGSKVFGLFGGSSDPDFCFISDWIVFLIVMGLSYFSAMLIGTLIQRIELVFPIGSILTLPYGVFANMIITYDVTKYIITGLLFAFGMIILIRNIFYSDNAVSSNNG